MVTTRGAAAEDGIRLIGEVAEAVGLPSGRSPGGFRLYTDADMAL